MDVKRKKKSLKLKVDHLKLELEDKEESIAQLEKEFKELLATLEVEEIPNLPQKPLPHEPRVKLPKEDNGAEPQEIDIESPLDHPEEYRKLWKQIASLTHPDKTGNDLEKTELYKRAAAAWTDGDYAELTIIAIELGIDSSDNPLAEIQTLESAAEQLENKIKSAENSVLWMWATAPPEKKEKIIDIYLVSKGKKRKKSGQ